MTRAAKGVYDAAWRRLRLVVLAEEPTCYGCGEPSTSVDHKVPVADAPHLRLVRSNLRGSCAKHNYGLSAPRLAAMARINRRTSGAREW